MSRLPIERSEATTPVTNSVMLLNLENSPVTATEVENFSKKDPTISQAIHYTLHGWPIEVEDNLKPFFIRRTELNCHLGCLQWGNRVIIPKELHKRVVEELHNSHPGISRMKALARSYIWWPNMDSDLERYVNGCAECQKHQKMPKSAPIHS